MMPEEHIGVVNSWTTSKSGSILCFIELAVYYIDSTQQMNAESTVILLNVNLLTLWRKE